MNIDLKDGFDIIEEGTIYRVPVYEVVDGEGIKQIPGESMPIEFVRGSKLKGEDVEKREGTLHEHLLSMMIHDLKYKNSLVPSREGALVITKLEEAYLWLLKRQIGRQKFGTLGTYKK